MDSTRGTSSRRDSTAGSSRDASNRSRPLDLTRPLNTGYDRAYSTHDAAGQGGSASGYDRSYSTCDAAGQGGCTSGYDRAYSAHDAAQRYSSHLGFSTMPLQEASSSQASEVAYLANRQKRLSKYEEEAKKYQEKDKDHRHSDFNKTYKTEIQYKKGVFHVVSENDHVRYENAINVSEGQIIGCRNNSKNTQSWHFSDII